VPPESAVQASDTITVTESGILAFVVVEVVTVLTHVPTAKAGTDKTKSNAPISPKILIILFIYSPFI
jgi:hypothetical protein